MRGPLLIALVALAGCDKLFGLLPVPVSDASSVDDANPMDALTDAATDDAVPRDANPDALFNGPCPASYTSAINTSRYRLGTATTWSQAQVKCLADQPPGTLNHTHLVVLTDDGERSFVFNSVNSGGMQVWIGLTDQKAQGFFAWVTDENTSGYPPSTNGPWASAQPSNGAGEDCVKLNAQADLDDIDCSTVHVYVCECDAFPNDPTNYN